MTPSKAIRLATVAIGRNEWDAGLRHAKWLLNASPAHGGAHYLCGRAFKGLGRPDDALEHYRLALECDPEQTDWRISLAIALRESGRTEEAIREFTSVLDRFPDNLSACVGLGNAFLAASRLDEAETQFLRTLERSPELPDAWNSLGRIAEVNKRWELAAERYSKAVVHGHTHVPALRNAARLMWLVGNIRQALVFLDMLVATQPGDIDALMKLGYTQRALGDNGSAEQSFRKVLGVDPAHRQAIVEVGYSLSKLGRGAEADSFLAEAEKKYGRWAALMTTRGLVRHSAGDRSEVIGLFKGAIALDPERADVSPLLFALDYSSETSLADLTLAHRQWGDRFAAGIATVSEREPRRPGPLRVGFISGDFKNHSVAFFFEPLLRHLDRNRFEVFLYSTGLERDEVTERLVKHASRFVVTAHQPDAEAVQFLLEDDLDVLIDLSGHTAFNRLGIVARRPARLIGTYLGYPTTTGLPNLDFRITDAVVDPPSEGQVGSEPPLRLAKSYFCYLPPAVSPEVEDPPSLRTGKVTFGSYNNTQKLSTACIRTWAKVLESVPQSRLLLKDRALADPWKAERVKRALEDGGVDIGRVELRAYIADKRSHLEAYGAIDIALDPYPYNGATTTCEALWMGVPLVSLRGGTHQGRMGASILSAAALDGYIVESEDDYVGLAARLASDLSRLAQSRRAQRANLAGSALLDAAAFAADFGDRLEQRIASACVAPASAMATG